MKADTADRPTLNLTEACWPVFEFITNFERKLKYGSLPTPEQIRFEALTALRDAEDLARDDPATERLWHDRVKAMMVYLLDYKMINTEWDGRNYWFDNSFEIDPEILGHHEALGGEEFFRECDEIQREYDQAERRDRRDRHELAELLSLYFTCLRLGFQGQFHDRPQELADYTRRLFTRLPAYASTRHLPDFPQAYAHNQEVRVNYNLGMGLTIVLVAFFLVIGGWIMASQYAWNRMKADINQAAEVWKAGTPSTQVVGEAGVGTATP